MNENDIIIEFEDVEITNGEIPIITSLNLTIREGEFVYITGKVGSGKTSNIRAITAENPVTTGRAQVGDFNLRNLKRKKIPYLRRKIGVVLQDFQLLMDRSVEDNLLFVLKSTGWKDRTQMNERINSVLEAVGVASKAHKMPHQLSGGEQQRVAIARALLNEPRLILADEPTGNLDGETATGIMRLLVEINRTRKTAILMVTHNMNIVREYPGRILVCADNECKEI